MSSRRPTGRYAAPLVVLAGVLLAAVPASASKPAPSPVVVVAVPEAMTLAQALDHLVTEGPYVRMARQQAAMSAAAVDQAAAARYPKGQLDVLFSVAPGTEGNVLETTDSMWSKWGPLVRVELTAEVPLYTFGAIGARVEAARTRLAAARARVASTVQDATLTVRKAWYEARAAHARGRVFDVATETLRELEVRLEAIEEADDEGFDPIDRLKLRVRETEVVAQATDARRAQALALARVRAAVGLAPDASLALEDGPMLPVLVALPPLDELVTLARTLNPALDAERRDEQALRVERRAVERSLYPELFLAGSFVFGYVSSRDPQGSPFADDEGNSWAGVCLLGLRLPLDIPQRVTARDVVSAAVRKKAADRRVRVRDLEMEVARAHALASDLLALLPVREDAAKASRGWWFARSSDYEMGTAGLGEVLKAHRQLVDRHVALVDAVLELNVAVATLSRAVGVDVTLLQGAGAGGDRLEKEAPRFTLPAGFELPASLPPELRRRLEERLRATKQRP